MNVGKRLRELREERGLLQDELARKAHVARNTVSRIERGRLTPTVTMLEKLARGLGVEPGILLSPTIPKASPPQDMDELLARAGVENNYLAMSPDEIVDYLETLPYEEVRVVVLEVIEARRAVNVYLKDYEETPEHRRLTLQSFNVWLKAFTYMAAEADKRGDTELRTELALA
jgi:transcriptional regulator with XRE-family HTH domain